MTRNATAMRFLHIFRIKICIVDLDVNIIAGDNELLHSVDSM